MLHTFVPDDLQDDAPVILYGAAMYGELAYNALQNLNIPVFAFCDRVQAGRYFCGLPVLAPEQLLDYPNAHILVCATKGLSGIVQYLQSISHKKCYEISNLLSFVEYNLLPPYCRALPIEDLTRKYQFYLCEHPIADLTGIDLPFVALSITERCTLKCKKCSVLATYYTQPCNDSLQDIIEPFQKFLSCVDSIAELQIGGGEPFVHKDLGTILKWCLKQEKIKEISIFTNSTIIPDALLIEVLSHPRIKLLLDDYGPLSKHLTEIVELCNQNSIRYLIQKFERWDDLGDYQDKEESEATLTEKFRYCSFGNVMSFMKGKLYRCTTAARIADLQMVTDDPDDYVDFRFEGEISVWRQQIRRLLFDKKYHLGCRICNGISISRLGIPVAEQL